MSAQQRAGRLPAGLWGGDHVVLEITQSGARVEFDCAHGRIERSIMLDGQNAFDVPGVYVQERGGPVRVNAQPNEQPARYAGRISGQTMTLTVTLANEQQTIGTYTLVRGQNPHLVRCL